MTTQLPSSRICMPGLLLLLVIAAVSSPSAVEAKKPKGRLLPCLWYPSDSNFSFYNGTCGTNDAFSVAIKSKHLGTSAIGKAFIKQTKKNQQCEKTLFDEAGCKAQDPKYSCIWYDNGAICQSNQLMLDQQSTCPGTPAREHYRCTVSYMNETACIADAACRWDPVLAFDATGSLTLSCFPKDAPSNLTAYRAWEAAGIFNTDPTIYAANWGDCAAAKSGFALTAYLGGCRNATTEQDCNDHNCQWNDNPQTIGQCSADDFIASSLQLAHSGVLTQQQQCFARPLTMRGEVACNNYTLV